MQVASQAPHRSGVSPPSVRGQPPIGQNGPPIGQESRRFHERKQRLKNAESLNPRIQENPRERTGAMRARASTNGCAKRVRATVLAAGKGWVLPVLAMLAATRLCVAARGSGPGAKRRRPCPPLRAVAGWRCRDEGCPATPTPRGPAGPASNKGWFRGRGFAFSPLPQWPRSCAF